MLNEFKKYLEDITYASPNQQQKELWNISGVLKNRLNQKLKFDTRPLTKEGFKIGSFKTKADKMVFFIDKWIIVDVEELHQYLRENNVKDVQLEDLISKLDWNIILPKN
jgi:hypothetical protein